jgi:hypothetical protein
LEHPKLIYGATASEEKMASTQQATSDVQVESQANPADWTATMPAWTETTRLMCAAAYLDGTFAQDVVEEIIEERHRAVQIPPGVDIAPVAKHCLAARRQKTIRDLILAGDVLLTLILCVFSFSPLWFALGFLIAWAVVLWDMWSATYYVVVKRLNARSFGLPDPALAQRVEELVESQGGNLIVYSGFLPFSCAGIDLGGWSFVVDLRKGRDELGERATPRPLEVSELYDEVERALRQLAIPNLTIADRLFVSGADIREDRNLLPDPIARPVWNVPGKALERFILSSTHRIRHYECITVVDWRGELVVSLFLRFSIRNGRLFCELSDFLLAPLKSELHRIDGQGAQIELRHVLAIVGRSLLATPWLSLRAPRIVFKPLGRSRKRAKRAKLVERDPFFDYGAACTALDRVRSTNYSRYFQRLDKEMYVKVLERTVLDTIADVLDRHGVDTAELAERRSTIINNGIMMGGGSIQGGNLAVGSEARVGIVNRMRSAAGGSRTADAPRSPAPSAQSS